MVPHHLVWNQAVCRPQLDMECFIIAMLFCVLMRLKKGRGTVRSLLTVQGTCRRNSPLAFVSNISLTTHENLRAAKEKQNIPAKSHSSGATDVEKHQACVSGLDQQISKQHHLPLDCWEDWWRAQTMLRWLTETWMDTTRKTSLRKLGQVIILNTSHHRHRHEVRRRREAVTGKGRNSFLFFPFTIAMFFSCVPPSNQRNAVALGEYYNPFWLRQLLLSFWSSSTWKLLRLLCASWTAEFKKMVKTFILVLRLLFCTVLVVTKWDFLCHKQHGKAPCAQGTKAGDSSR